MKRLSTEEQEQVKALAASGMACHSIAKQLNRSPHTIKRYLVQPDAQQDIARIRTELASMFEDVAKRMIGSISDADIGKLNAYQRTLSAGISVDKAAGLRNLSGQAGKTEICIRIVGHDGTTMTRLAVGIEAKQAGTQEATEE